MTPPPVASAGISSTAALDVRVVSHTHWDREWYHSAGRFRQRLVPLVDELLDRPPELRVPFLLDGQAVVLEDYLAVRPERSGAITDALREGWLEAGPWYVLADEQIPGAEALVRNLLAGRELLDRLGAGAPPVLYSPDSFGHPAAMPELARGFGLPVAIVWRGYGGARWPAGDTVEWRAASGASVILYHLPPSGYELGSNLPVEDAGARDWWARNGELLVDRARLGLALLPNGADHHALQDGAGAALEALARAAVEHAEVSRSTLTGFARELERRARAASLPVVEGELRDSYGYTWTLQGTLATRASQKRSARILERLLVRDVEPWLALSPAGATASERASLGAAWRTLLRCHPHDTLCGCSSDVIGQAMDARLASGMDQALALRDRALQSLLGHDAVEARARRDAWRPALVVRNAAPRPRGGVVEAELDSFVADVPVGPGSRQQHSPRRRDIVPVVDGGRRVVQRLDARTVHDLTESPRHYPDCDLVRRTRALLWLDAEVPALGTLSLALDDAAATGAGVRRPGPGIPVSATARSLDNGALSVEVDDAGRVTLVAAGERMPDLVGVESVGDVGDTYTHSPVGETSRGWSFAGSRLEAAGPLRGTIALRYVVRVPRSRTRVRASRAIASIPITVRISLDADAPYLRLDVSGDNRARDHRLRLVVRTGARDAAVRADAAFGPVRRDPLRVPEEDQAAETVPATAPLHRYVSLFGERAGATLYSDGLAEYEAGSAGEIMVTLVRAVGELSRNDLPERDGHAGWPVPTPAAQCPGPFEASFAILPHGPRTSGEIARVEHVADDFLHPLRAFTLRSALRPPPSTTGARLTGDGLAFGAVKPAARDGGWVVLRCVNLLEEPVDGNWTLDASYREAHRARLDETRIASVPIEAGALQFTAAPREVVTFLVRC
ncbi:MAG TPA: glycoside hydrolase family 38 C-terminal domain-containing protein [Gemmatimonadales bacterium]